MFEDQPLKDGVVGAGIVAWFEERGQTAVWAESLCSQGNDLHDYMITFENGIKQAYRIAWKWDSRYEVLDATPLN
jgi:hypothetical protein